MEAAAYNNTVRVTLELLNTEKRAKSAALIRDEWQQLIGPLPNVRPLDISFTNIPLWCLL